MSANAGVLQATPMVEPRSQASPVTRGAALVEGSEWNPERYTREQIRGLVRRVFFPAAEPAAKQVVFSAMDAVTCVAALCDQVGRALALETAASVAILGRGLQVEDRANFQRYGEPTAIKSWSAQVSPNLWRVPDVGLRANSENSGTGHYWLSCLAQLRSEFEYVVIQGPTAGISIEAALLGQMADGIVLVLGARTRKATARQIKQTLQASQSRILGTVLSERTFPVPEKIYRRL